MEICKGFHENVQFYKSRPVNWILENNLLIKSSKVEDLNADTNGTSDLSGHFFINVLKVSLNLTVYIRE